MFGFGKLFGKSPAAPSAQKPTWRPSLEVLEDRYLLSGALHGASTGAAKMSAAVMPTANLAASTSTVSSGLNRTADRAATTTAIGIPGGPGTPLGVTVSAVSPSTATPTGTVTLREGTTNLASVTLNEKAQALFTGALPPGPHNITATYNGDANFTGSTSPSTFVFFTESRNQQYVVRLYQDLLGRLPDSGGFTFWSSLLDQNRTTRSEVALAFVNSPEYRMREVKDVYHTFLHREADPVGLSGWTQFLQQENTLEQLEARIVASPEYLQSRAGGNSDHFLATLFMDAFNRPLDQTGSETFGDEFDSGGDRRRVAEQIFTTAEFRQDLVRSDYQRFLNRGADPGGLGAAVAALKSGLRTETLIATIVGSPEYNNRGFGGF